MIKFECKKCNSKEFFIKAQGNQKGLYCADCGSWHKWLNKNECIAYENALNKKVTEKVITNFDVFNKDPESLAAFVREYRINDPCNYCTLKSRACGYRCKAGLVGWLNQLSTEQK